MLEIIMGVASGGATGLLGIGLGRFFDWLNAKAKVAEKKLDFEHAQQMKRIDGELMDKEWAARLRVADREADAEETVAREESFAASFNMEPKRFSNKRELTPMQHWLMVVLDFVRGAVRPGMTVYLCAVVTLLAFEVNALMEVYGAVLDQAQVFTIYERIIFTILYLFTTVTLWWFGTRNQQSPPKTEKG